MDMCGVLWVLEDYYELPNIVVLKNFDFFYLFNFILLYYFLLLLLIMNNEYE